MGLRVTRAAALLASGVIPVIVFYLLISDFDVFVTDDSTEYISFARGLLSGDYSFLTTTAGFRTPGYPLLLLVTESILGPDLQNVLWLHLLITILAGGISVFLLRKLINPFFSLGIFTSSLLLFIPFFSAILTEWSMGCLLIATYVLSFAYFSSPNIKTFGAVCFLVSFGILCRPPMMGALFVPICLMFYPPKDRFFTKLIVLLSCLLIPLTWAGFNFYREGVFALSPRVGFWRLAQAGVLKEIPVDQPSTEEQNDLKIFRDKFESRRQSLSAISDQEKALEKAFNKNYAVALDVSREMGLSFAEGDRLAQQLAVPAIRKNLQEYLVLITRDFLSQVSYASAYLWAVCLLALGFSLRAIRVADSPNLGIHYSLYLSFLVHLIHTGSAVLFVPMLPRLFWLTFVPFFFLSAVVLAHSIKFVRADDSDVLVES